MFLELPSESEDFYWHSINVFIVTLLLSCGFWCFFPAVCEMREETPMVDKSIVFWYIWHLALVLLVHFSIQQENLGLSIHWLLKYVICVLDILKKTSLVQIYFLISKLKVGENFIWTLDRGLSLLNGQCVIN